MLPNYLVIGAQKCATSSFCYLLGQHPDIFMSNPKELHFFSRPEVWRRGWSWYESLFEAGKDCTAIGEGSTTYTQHYLHPEAPDRIAKHLSQVKLIYIVRDPLERMESQWMYLRAMGNREKRTFNEAVRGAPEYIDNGLYHYQLTFYRQRFKDDRILVLFLEDFRLDRGRVLERCFTFLGVDATAALAVGHDVRKNVSAEGRVDTAALTALRRIPRFREMRNRAPKHLRELLRRILKRPIRERPEWDESTRCWAMEQLAEDSSAFLKTWGKPADFWPWLRECGMR